MKPLAGIEKTEQDLEDELLASSDDEEKSVADDGIDLFASEDSESENEGRFKSSSKRTERTAGTATVSFSRLGAPNAPVVRNLEEVRSEKQAANRRDRDSGRDRGERDRERNGHGRNNYAGRRNERNYGRKSNSRERDRARDRTAHGSGGGGAWKSSKHDDNRNDEKSDRDGDRNKKALPSRSSNKPVPAGDIKKSSADGKSENHNLKQQNNQFVCSLTDKATNKSADIRDKPAEKRTVIQLKRPTSIIVEKGKLTNSSL